MKEKEQLKRNFIEKAILKHGKIYDYSKVEYVNNKTKVVIMCPVHGDFEMTPTHHLSGQKCPKCRGMNKTTEEWIKEAKLVHGDRYEYGNTNYDGSHKKLKVTCRKHGDFEVIAKDHLKGNGCPLCKFEKISELKRGNTEDFIKKAVSIHGDKYDYSKVVYNKSSEKVTIICPIHGEFEMTPNNHLRGQGCPKCVGKHKTTEEIIEEFRCVHGNKYDYSNVEYQGKDKKVRIICLEHGEFTQTPSAHLIGQGCPLCSMSHLENKVNQMLKSEGIDHIYETNLENLLKRYSVDFFLPEMNIIIECQGGQHFYPAFNRNNIEKATKIHESVLTRDIIKRKLLSNLGDYTVLYYTDIPDLPDDIFENEKYCGIYNEKNFFTNLETLAKKIKSISLK